MSRRFQNWPVLLAQFIEERRERPFAWGAQDCCLLACDWIQICTGLDPAANFRGKYDDALGAARVLKEFEGVEGVAAAQCEAFDFVEVRPLMAQRGDVVLADGLARGPALGVCEGYYSVFPGANGLEFYLTGAIRRAWRVA